VDAIGVFPVVYDDNAAREHRAPDAAGAARRRGAALVDGFSV